MDKKLFGSIITVLILLSVLWVVAMSSSNTVDDITLLTNGSYVVNWSSNYNTGGKAMVLNFTLLPNFTAATATAGVSEIINITLRVLPTNAFNLSLNAANPLTADGADVLVYYQGFVAGAVVNKTAYTCSKKPNDVIQCLNNTIVNSTEREWLGNSTIVLLVHLVQNTSTSTEVYDNDFTITMVTNDSTSNSQTRHFGVDDLAPRIKSFNISDGTNVKTSKDGDFNGSLTSGGVQTGYFNVSTLNVTILLTEFNRDTIQVRWNWNGTYKSIRDANGTVLDIANKWGAMSTSCHADATTTQECLYSFEITSSNFTSGSTYSIIIWTNDSFAQESNFTNGGIGYNITIDATTPSGNLVVGKTSIFATDSIKVKCDATDEISPVTAEIKITKPSKKTITKIVYGKDQFEYTFKDTDTNEAGKYLVDCTVTDFAGNTGPVDQKSFLVYFSDTSSGDEFGAGEEAPVAKTDISTVEKYSGIIGGKQGESKTFTIDGATAHTIEFIEVTLTSAKLMISSLPVEITLNIGKSMNVDVDGDGADDIKVSLTSIEDGLAKVEVVNLAKQIEKETGVTPEIPEVPEEEGNAGIWITVLVIIIVIAVGYYILKSRKSKKGDVKFSKQDLGL